MHKIIYIKYAKIFVWHTISQENSLKSYVYNFNIHITWIYKYIYTYYLPYQFSSTAHLCLTLSDPWTAARQASLSNTNSQILPKLLSIESLMPSNHLILCCPLLPPLIFPTIRVFPMSKFFESDGQSIGVSASASVLPMNTQDWLPLGGTSWISLQSKGLSRVFSNTTVQQYQFLGAQLSL